ncbi:uncharacterized protein TrAFT101_009530 [Trichoderma asperellum]|uniref:uncharacterized protein n=1 Tax=Trichoderma asperellum TaxID=101201 RepID=UPI00331A3CCD|nr:hypothetical protein TrAFT101_009530 [Trichoderma asperellum]
MAITQDIVYHGNCHCGRYCFQVSAPNITSAISCTCSLCTKKGYLWLVPAEGSFTVVRDEGCLTEYRTSTLADKFCNYCGSGVVGKHLSGSLQGQFLINIRTLREPYVNPFKLESISTTSAFESKDEARVRGSFPRQSMETTANHLFSCHCGDVRAKFVGSVEAEELKEDNCSKCVRTAYIGIYPSKDAVRMYGRDRVFEYLTGGKFTGATYCKTCGVHVFSNIYGPPISVFDKLPAEKKERALAVYHKNMSIQPLNVRAMNDLDLDAIRSLIKREDEGTEGYNLDLP